MLQQHLDIYINFHNKILFAPFDTPPVIERRYNKISLKKCGILMAPFLGLQGPSPLINNDYLIVLFLTGLFSPTCIKISKNQSIVAKN